MLVHDRCLYYFRLREITNEFGRVEFARFAANDGFQNSDVIKNFAIPYLQCDDVRSNGKLTISEGHLYFIKLRNTAHGVVEVFQWTKKSYWLELHSWQTPFREELADLGQWNIWSGRLVFVQTSGANANNQVRNQATEFDDFTKTTPAVDVAFWNEHNSGDFYVTPKSDVILVRYRDPITVYICANSRGLSASRPIGVESKWGVSATTGGTICFDKVSRWEESELQPSNWMACLPHDTELTTLSIPGTHDSHSTEYNVEIPFPLTIVSTIAETQRYEIGDQLNFGVRFLDLRVGEDKRMRHGRIQLRGKLADCLNVIQDFLRGHPSETVLVSVKWDHETITGSSVAQPDWFHGYVEDEWDWRNWPRTEEWPTLSSVRGKAILLRRYSGNCGQGNCGIDLSGVFGGQGKFSPGAWHQQDNGTNTAGSYDYRLELAKTELRKAMADPIDNKFMYFTNLAGIDGVSRAPVEYSNALNTPLTIYVNTLSAPQRLGVIMMDFMKDGISRSIYTKNVLSK